MPTKIENLSGRKVLIHLSSGEALHIAPHMTSAELSDVEVDNPKVQKLQNRHVIMLHRVAVRDSRSRASRSAQAKKRPAQAAEASPPVSADEEA